MSDDRKALFEALRRLRTSWVSRGWSWDRRFECVASTFDVTLTAEANRAITAELGSEWNSDTIASAPLVVRRVAEQTGGVRSDQRILATGRVDGMIAYGLWWPWGGEGTNISMRVGIAGQITGGDVIDFRELFGALDD